MNAKIIAHGKKNVFSTYISTFGLTVGFWLAIKACNA